MTADELYDKQDNFVVRFFRGIIRLIRNFFVIIGVLTVVGVGLLVWAAIGLQYHAAPPMKSVSTDSVVLLNLDGVLTSRSPKFKDFLLGQFFGDGRDIFYTEDLRAALEKAAVHENVKGLYITLRNLQGSLASVEELREALMKFRQSEKPIAVHLVGGDNSSLLLASAATRIGMTPTGTIFAPGPTFQLVYFADTLRKLGVTADVIRHGEFKSAFEPLVENEPSAATIEQYSAMETALRDYFVESLSLGRKRPLADGRSWLAQGLFTGQEAQSQGIVDELIFEPLFRKAFLAEMKTTEEVNLLDLNGMSGSGLPTIGSEGQGLALIEASGEIAMSADGARDDAITPDLLIPEIRWAKEKEDVRAVILRIDSPGGDAVAADIIWHELQELAAVKPLIVSMGSVAASGGYYLAAPAAHIVAQPSTITGSIGVIGMVMNFADFREKYGISFHTIAQTERKRLLDLGSAMSDQDRALLLASIDSTYKTFVERVGAGRHMEVEQVDRLGGGRVYTGIEAKRLGLVDSLGGLAEAFRVAKDRAGLNPDSRFPLFNYEEPGTSLSECLQNPRDMMKCLRRLRSGARIFSPALTSLTGTAQEERVLRALQRWPRNRPFVAALWTGYLGVQEF